MWIKAFEWKLKVLHEFVETVSICAQKNHEPIGLFSFIQKQFLIQVGKKSCYP